MATQFITAAGTTIAVSASLPASETESAYGALTYTEIDLVSEGGEVGPEDTLVTFTPLKDPTVQKAQGSRNYGSQPLNMAYSTVTDAGVGILETAHDDRNNVAVKMTLPDGAIRYYQAKCMGVREIIGGADAVLGLQSTLEITTAVIKVAAP